MKEEKVYDLSRRALEPLVGIIAEKLFGLEFEMSNDTEDKVYKIDIKNKDMTFNLQVKTKQGPYYHYFYKLEDELKNNKYIAFYDIPFNNEIIEKNNLLIDLDAFKKYVVGSFIYFVDTDYLRILKDNNEIDYIEKYHEFWIKDRDSIEKYYDTMCYEATKEPYVIKYEIKWEDLNNE